MDLDGPTGAGNPESDIAAALANRDRLQDELRSIEMQAYELETSYLQESLHCGSVLTGFEEYLSSTRSGTNLRRSARIRLKDRMFSLSSVTSPGAKEQHPAASHDGRSANRRGRPRIGGFSASGRGILKKGGRIEPRREGRKVRFLNELDLDGEDD
ncbi:hypothetical protein KFK09_003350 [Dendrobium nobile]|uniref:Chromatin modification-related protein MEAF6 n=1 Tax=Dendrobium nobile TaxID=94219 RepID=A0A8T3BXH5_DENNO|nr:hypothetical protein KFK09_003350 [Dendrobium nobile]